MADQINVSGITPIYVQFRDTDGTWTGALSKLGESLDMVDVEERIFTHNVPGDRYGGPQGPPIEQQFLGEIHVVRMELSRWDPAIFDQIRKRGCRDGLGSHASGEIGRLMLQNRSMRLLLNSATRPVNYPTAIPNSSIQYGKGTKFSSVSLQFECHVTQQTDQKDILWDRTTTVYT